MHPFEREHRDDWYEGVADHLALLQASDAITEEIEDIVWSFRWSLLYGPPPTEETGYRGLAPREAAVGMIFDAYNYKATGQSELLDLKRRRQRCMEWERGSYCGGCEGTGYIAIASDWSPKAGAGL